MPRTEERVDPFGVYFSITGEDINNELEDYNFHSDLKLDIDHLRDWLKEYLAEYISHGDAIWDCITRFTDYEMKEQAKQKEKPEAPTLFTRG